MVLLGMDMMLCWMILILLLSVHLSIKILVFVYKEGNVNNWSLADIITSIPKPMFGFFVDIEFSSEMSTVVVGSKMNGLHGTGAVYMCTYGNSSVTFQWKLITINPFEDAVFGLSLAFSGKKIAVGVDRT